MAKNATKSIKMSIDFVIQLCELTLSCLSSSVFSIQSLLLLLILHSSLWRHTDSFFRKSWTINVCFVRLYSLTYPFDQRSNIHRLTNQTTCSDSLFFLSHKTIIISTMAMLLVRRAFNDVQIFQAANGIKHFSQQ